MDNVEEGFVFVNHIPVMWRRSENTIWIYAGNGSLQKKDISSVESPTAQLLIALNPENAFSATFDYDIVTKKFADQTYVAKTGYDTLSQKVTELESKVTSLTETITQLQGNALTALDRQTLNVIERI